MTSLTGLEGQLNQTEKNRIRWAVALFFFGQGLGFATWASRIPIFKTDLGLTEAALGTLLFMIPIGQMITLPLSAFLVNKFGSREVLPVAAILYAFVLILIGLVPNAWYLGVALFLFGVTGNTCNIAVNTQGVLAEEIYGKPIMSSFHGAWSLAGFTGALIGLLTMHFEMTTIQHLTMMSMLLIANVLFNKRLLVPELKKEKEVKEKGKFKPDSLLIQLGIIGFFSMATEGAMFEWSGVYFSEVVKAPEKLILLGFGAFMVMMALGRFVGDGIVAKIGKQRTLQVSGVLMFVGMLISVLFPNLYICTFAFMLVGLGVACNVPIVYSVTGKHHRIPAGVALTIVSSISFLGFLLTPTIIGFIAELFNLQYSFALFSLFGLFLFLMVSRLKIFNA